MKSKGVSPRVVDQATRDTTIDPKLETSSGAYLDLVVGVCSRPCADIGPVPILTHRLGRHSVVEKVDVVLGSARVSTESVGN